MIKDCEHLRRFLQPSVNVSSQVAAYCAIAELFGPVGPVHKFEAFLQKDKRLASYLMLAEQADASDDLVYCDVRAIMLKDAIEAERVAIASAPQAEAGSAKGDAEGPASKRIIKALMALRGEAFIIALEKQLIPLWTSEQHRPTEVFEVPLRARVSRVSQSCSQILRS